MTHMVVSGLVFSWTLAGFYDPVAGSAPGVVAAAGFEAAFLLQSCKKLLRWCFSFLSEITALEPL